MHITMVKKQLEGGRACEKCLLAEELLRNKGLWGRIDEVVWAVDGDPNSPGILLAARKGVKLAPFFVVRDDAGTERTYESVLRLIRECFGSQLGSNSESSNTVLATPGAPILPRNGASGPIEPIAERELCNILDQIRNCSPQRIIDWALERYGNDCAISFSGAEDVMLIDLAKKSGKPFSVFCLDTGRLHPETYEFIERVREHYGITIEIYWPDVRKVQELVRNKGLFSFYRDGHAECCSIRKVEPLERALGKYCAWVTGQRRDQSPTRKNVEIVELDRVHQGLAGPLLKFNPLAALSLGEVWSYLRDEGLPYNPLHDRGFVSIGCAPCTRAARPGEHERAGRWWWEDSTKRECGLHLTPTKP